MFNSIVYVRNLCKEKRIPISQLEKDCGFSNGYLNPKKVTVLPYNRAIIISKYLNIPVEDILNGPSSGNEKTPTNSGERISDDDLKFALWGGADDITEEDLEDVRRYAAFVRARKKESK